jgi:hypothetical protein
MSRVVSGVRRDVKWQMSKVKTKCKMSKVIKDFTFDMSGQAGELRSSDLTFEFPKEKIF